jgi:hypothetical protein
MLELSKIVSDLPNVCTQLKANQIRRTNQIRTAKMVASDIQWTNEQFRKSVSSVVTQRLTAKLISALPIESCFDAPAQHLRYSVVAVDGSQIPIDRHSALPYYLINIGRAIIHYGTGERPDLSSTSKLFFLEDDLFVTGDQDEMSYKTASHIAGERERREFEELNKIVLECAARQNVVCFVDGTLILWAQDPGNATRHKHPAISQLNKLLTDCRMSNILPAGYISRPGSRDVINLLRNAMDGREDNGSGGELLDRISDADLFWDLLPTGARSIVFGSSAKVLQDYKPADNRIFFFYLNTGSEIARIEIPAWIARDTELVERVHAVAYDQANKGGGYPISLLEAHEQAVVRTAERFSVDQLIENEMHRRGIQVTSTSKALAKRIRPI